MSITTTIANAKDAWRQARGIPTETWSEEPNKYEQWDTDTRFEKAAQIVDRRDGHASKRARDWQLITGCVTAVWLATSAVLGFGWYQQAQVGAKVFAVPIDKLGQQGTVFVPEDYRPTAATIGLLAKDFIDSTFTKSDDANENVKSWQFMRAVIADNALYTLDRWAKTENTDDRVFRRIVQNIGSRPTTNPKRWFVSWDAIEYAKPGEARPLRHFEGEVTIEFRKISAAMAMINPSGLVVTDFIFAEQRR